MDARLVLGEGVRVRKRTLGTDARPHRGNTEATWERGAESQQKERTRGKVGRSRAGNPKFAIGLETPNSHLCRKP